MCHQFRNRRSVLLSEHRLFEIRQLWHLKLALLCLSSLVLCQMEHPTGQDLGLSNHQSELSQMVGLWLDHQWVRSDRPSRSSLSNRQSDHQFNHLSDHRFDHQ